MLRWEGYLVHCMMRSDTPGLCWMPAVLLSAAVIVTAVFRPCQTSPSLCAHTESKHFMLQAPRDWCPCRPRLTPQLPRCPSATLTYPWPCGAASGLSTGCSLCLQFSYPRSSCDLLPLISQASAEAFSSERPPPAIPADPHHSHSGSPFSHFLGAASWKPSFLPPGFCQCSPSRKHTPWETGLYLLFFFRLLSSQHLE